MFACLVSLNEISKSIFPHAMKEIHISMLCLLMTAALSAQEEVEETEPTQEEMEKATLNTEAKEDLWLFGYQGDALNTWHKLPAILLAVVVFSGLTIVMFSEFGAIEPTNTPKERIVSNLEGKGIIASLLFLRFFFAKELSGYINP